MEKYQLFAVSAFLLILANYWHFLVNSNPFIPRLLDYIAYGFFLFGIFKLFKKD
ncbi:MAG: hypothetical protein WC678_03105 [Parcubacteria group bacterium]|jgi:hypothetical protein